MSRPAPLIRSLVGILLAVMLAGCRYPLLGGRMTVTIQADGEARTVEVPAGSTVLQALQAAGITPGEMDRAEPPFYAVLSDGNGLKLTRVREEFETEHVVIPYERQTVRNETLPEGQTQLVQAGVNGQNEVTFRRVLEDGTEVSRSQVKTVVVQEPLPEIVMVGVQASFTPLSVPGTLVYLAGGNAWLMDGSTANRRLLVSTGDLDGRVFVLSPNGEYLVFTRKSKKPADQEINTLWVLRTGNTTPKPLYLEAKNVVHFAAWIPGTNSIAYSTVDDKVTYCLKCHDSNGAPGSWSVLSGPSPSAAASTISNRALCPASALSRSISTRALIPIRP